MAVMSELLGYFLILQKMHCIKKYCLNYNMNSY